MVSSAPIGPTITNSNGVSLPSSVYYHPGTVVPNSTGSPTPIGPNAGKPGYDYAGNPVNATGNAMLNARPTLNANITTPVPRSVGTPAVITSESAAKDFSNVGTQLSQLHQDAQAQAMSKSPAPSPTQSTPTQTTDTTPTTTPDTDTSASDQISALLDNLTKSISDTQDDTTVTDDNGTPETSADITTDQEQNDSDYTAAYNEAHANLDAIASGTYPLSATDTQLLSSTISQYQQAITQQQAANTAFTGALGHTLAALGIDMTAPTQALGVINASISQGQQKVADLDTKMTAATAKLQSDFQSQDYKNVLDSWNDTAAYFKQRTDALQKMQTDVAAAVKAHQTAVINTTKEAVTAIINTDKLNETQKQNQVNNLLKSSTLDEKTRHDLQTESTAAFKANTSATAAGTKPQPNIVQGVEDKINATRGSDGYADPNVYKAAFDAWTGSGYAAKDFVKNYPPKTFINPVNDWLPQYLESKTSSKAFSIAGGVANPFQ